MAFALRHPYQRRHAADNAAADEATRRDGVTAAGTVDPAVQERAARRPRRARLIAGRSAWAMGSVMLLLARIVRLLVALLVALIVVGIALRVLDANSTNGIVRDLHDAARAVVGPFDGIFSFRHQKVAIAVNWGIAAVVYAIIGGVIVRLIARAAPRGLPPADRAV